MLIVGICGIGFVGNAILTTFMKFISNHIENNCKISYPIKAIFSYDKYKNLGQFEDLLQCDIIFLCLPTLFSENLNTFDISELDNTLKKLHECEYTGLIVIKSTVMIGYTQSKNQEFAGLKIVYNPEFLTARTASYDFENQKHIIVGYDVNKNIDYLNLMKIYDYYYPSSKITVCKNYEAEMCKLACNAFYATKVQFFTEIWDLCQKTQIDFITIKGMMLDNGWINPMHTSIPGPDGKISFGGACFPKDIKVLLSQMCNFGSHHKVIEAVIAEQQEIRNT
jgi:UDPglucose 6-dehydrogenase